MHGDIYALLAVMLSTFGVLMYKMGKLTVKVDMNTKNIDWIKTFLENGGAKKKRRRASK
jgi:hypothetical protein